MTKQDFCGWKGLLGAAAIIGAVAGITICAVRSRAAWLESKDYCDEDSPDDWEYACGSDCDCDSAVPPEVIPANEDAPTVPEGEDEDFEGL
ncbi:MAG: hypothetical protein H6Q60_931 [Oscillospiraceae bacterium]|nr:hypothetical protein [Oscillospiraceae bacterium]